MFATTQGYESAIDEYFVESYENDLEVSFDDLLTYLSIVLDDSIDFEFVSNYVTNESWL